VAISWYNETIAEAKQQMNCTKMNHLSDIFAVVTSYREIATSHCEAMLLAMTVVFDTWLHTPFCSHKRSFT
jgi:hypothetical protein